jgi:hypothetical protein
MNRDLLKVFETAAEQKAARQRAAERGRRRGKRAVASASLAYERRSDGGHTPKLVVGCCCVNEPVLI